MQAAFHISEARLIRYNPTILHNTQAAARSAGCSGSLDIPLESKGALESLTSIETQITLLKTEEAGLAELYTPEHPSYKAVLDKLAVLAV